MDRRGLAWTALQLQDHAFGLDGAPPPAPLVFNRLAISAFLRQREHPLYYAQALYAYWESLGADTLNGGTALAVSTTAMGCGATSTSMRSQTSWRARWSCWASTRMSRWWTTSNSASQALRSRLDDRVYRML